MADQPLLIHGLLVAVLAGAAYGAVRLRPRLSPPVILIAATAVLVVVLKILAFA